MRLFNLRIICFLLAVILLSGCSNSLPVLAVPEQVSYEDELKIAQLSQQLSQNDIDTITRMQLIFERGIVYDSLGFKAFAYSDFTHLLSFNPEIPDLYNFLGNYALRDGDFDSALASFNTTLELDPAYAYAYLNRAITLYRTGHYQSADRDALQFYQYDVNEPIRILWLYLIEKEIDNKVAQHELQKRYDLLNDKTIYSSDIVAFYLGKINESKLMQNLQQGVESNRQLAERLCEAYFYLGKYYQSKGDNERAKMLFKYALANNIYNFVEHQQALYEMKLLEEKEK
ncbi:MULTISPECIES: lipoprotein NlpI [unclassified Gilliamella]|uniref:lipoprotein NlpI n=1 Tax=unclassified Gilliamella TaxID=2685620 RepID=UPI00226A8920|nr:MULTISPECIES: lipoprotein NlpI [unclassified Gilliamella]MCX8641586.1 lipoprotein NlpI [Gilliamella sp. B3835]MCX8706801.1 lipoprotein NlpI [Gilliamella sp. B3783]MCX8708659.1 lipoprotein NlpI [Gilliamella sp. B3780]MCX8711053.1 lipoprotein NlpI [Gilliamella sp. B3468]MCX8713810.1 lipoprotein NlpI [Gilliamella sp. B3781]